MFTMQQITGRSNQVDKSFPEPKINMSTTGNVSVTDRIKPKQNSYIKEQPTYSENLKNYFSQYCKSSGVHGVRYLGESGRFIIEK